MKSSFDIIVDSMNELFNLTCLIFNLFLWTLGFWLLVCVGCPTPDPSYYHLGVCCWYPTIGLVFMAAGFLGLIMLIRGDDS